MTTLFRETFETMPVSYSVSEPEFTDGAGDFFTRTDGSNVGSFYEVTGAEGDSWFAAMDLDGEGASLPLTMMFEDIDISGYADLSFSGLFAEDDAGEDQNWDADDFVRVEASIDGGAWQNVLAFRNNGDTFNTEPQLDTDFDGVGDGAALTDEFARFSAAIAGTGSTLDLRLTLNLDSGDEDISFDDISISGTAGEPEPPAETVVLDESFDDATGFNVSGGFFSDGGYDFFGLAGAGDFGGDAAPSGVKDYENTAGNFLTGMDLDGEGGSATRRITWSNLDISGLSNLSFSGDLGEYFDDPGDIDDVDYVKITASIDGGEEVTLLDFRGAEFTSSGRYNGVLRLDTDADGVGDGAALGSALQNFSAAIGGTGNSLELTLEVSFDAGDEDFAADNFRIVGQSGGAASPAVIASAGDGISVSEEGETTDSFSLRLATLPASPVTVQVASDGETEVSADGETWGATAEVTLSGTEETAVFVRAVDDAEDEAASHVGTLSFTVTSDDADYDGLAISDLTAAVADNEVTLISSIQGAAEASPLEGQEVTVEAVVTGLVTNGSGVVGYYLQEEDVDRDGEEATSEGVYVYDSGADVAVGDKLRVTASVSEYFGLTELTSVSSRDVLETGVALPTATQITLGMSENFEAYEAMRVTLVSPQDADPLTVIENYNLARYGEVVVSEGVQYQPTQLYDPDTQSAEIAALMEANAENRLTIGDFSNQQNPDTYQLVDSGDGTPLTAGDEITAEGPTLRLGAQIEQTGVTGVLDYSYGDFNLRTGSPLNTVEGTNAEARPADAPEVGGDLQVASFNVLNYFTTLEGGTGPDGDLEPRGATTPEDFARQTDKIVAALLDLDAEIIGLEELENNGFGEGSAIDALVDALNAQAGEGTYAYVDPGVDYVGTDAITTGLIYKPAEVTLTGSSVLVYDEASADATYDIVQQIEAEIGSTGFGDYQRNRPTIAASFETGNGGEVTVAVNHFKSKGDSGLADVLDDAIAGGASQELIDALRNDANFDQGNGQGFWNGVREDAAGELADWLEGNPGGLDDTENVLLLGDLNSYAREDPVEELSDEGFTDLAAAELGSDAYSYVFDGQRGTLDYAFASEALEDQVTGVAEWHINADEPSLLNYSSEFTNPAFYNDDVYSASDHDPIVVGLTLQAPTVTARIDFEDHGWKSFARYTVEGETVASHKLHLFDKEIDLKAAGIEISAEDGRWFTPEWLATSGDGLSVRSLFGDRILSREARQIDERESVILELDDRPGLGDATAVEFEFTNRTGDGGVELRFFDDGALVDSVEMALAGDSLSHDLAGTATFDEVRISATDDAAFELSAVEFERLGVDDFQFA